MSKSTTTHRAALKALDALLTITVDLESRLASLGESGVFDYDPDRGAAMHRLLKHAGHVMGPMSEYTMGSGLVPEKKPGEKFLVYGDLRAMRPWKDYRKPDREIEIRLSGNMERYIWTINGKKFSEAEPIRLRLGERVRFKFVNETMMSHPMHLHGMWMQLDNGNGRFSPLKHVINVTPGMTISADVPVDAVGEWAFHCHLLYHMASGMMRKIIVEQKTAEAQ